MKKSSLVKLLLTLAALNTQTAIAAPNSSQDNHKTIKISSANVETRLSKISQVLRNKEIQLQNQEEIIAGGWADGNGRDWVNGRGSGWGDGYSGDWGNARVGGWADGSGGSFANANPWRNGWADGGGFLNYR